MRNVATLVLLGAVTLTAPRVALAQAHPDFGGKWSLDVSKSQGEMVPVSSEMTVVQTDNQITVTKATQTQAGPQNSIANVTLDGKPTNNTMTAQGMTVVFTSTAVWIGPTLVITTDATVNGQPLHQIDHWSLDADKKVATETSELTVGDQSASLKLVFNKK
jgi:hypothetical protein